MSKIKRAMILAAGFGTRLKPLTDSVPKALIKVNGIPMIETVIRRLTEFGVEEIIVNTHYLPEQIRSYFNKNNFGAEIVLLHESEILGTGGAIKNAEKFLKDAGSFIVHNVDVISEIDFEKFEKYHFINSALATLAVKVRETKRPLIIDRSYNVIGRSSGGSNYYYREPGGQEIFAGFCGVHIISSSIFKQLDENGFFDIFTAYFRLIGFNKKIIAFDTGDTRWEDIGTLDCRLHSL